MRWSKCRIPMGHSPPRSIWIHQGGVRRRFPKLWPFVIFAEIWGSPPSSLLLLDYFVRSFSHQLPPHSHFFCLLHPAQRLSCKLQKSPFFCYCLQFTGVPILGNVSCVRPPIIKKTFWKQSMHCSVYIARPDLCKAFPFFIFAHKV